MTLFDAAVSDYGLNKYLQVLSRVDHSDSPRQNAAPFSYTLREGSTLRETLDTYMELLQLRLGVRGAFVTLANENTPYFLAGTPNPNAADERPESASWLGTADIDLQRWLHIFWQTLNVNTNSESTATRVFASALLAEEHRISQHSTVSQSPYLVSYLGTPVTTSRGLAIGAVFVVNDSTHEAFSDTDEKALVATAEKCMRQLDLKRESIDLERWRCVNEQLDRFVGSRAIRSQLLEEPRSLRRIDQQRRRQDQIGKVQALAHQHGKDPPKDIDASPENVFSAGDETKLLLHAEAETQQNIVNEEETRKARRSQDETTYRKVFRRAADCVREALQVDGVLFIDGLIGYHGGVQPVAETEAELEREMAQHSQRQGSLDSTDEDTSPFEGVKTQLNAPLHPRDLGEATKFTSSRTYTSPEYRRGICIERPAEILGMSTRSPEFAPMTRTINESTLGLANLDEGFLQLLIDDHPDGAIWYLHGTGDVCYIIQNGTSLVDDLSKETQQLISNFKGARQMLFLPMKDPVTLKRLAGCFAWSTRPLPVFDDTTDLLSLRGFLHVLESEIARIDASAAVKQKEDFVSSVSHELRTPLHGILGAVQLLADTGLDSFQQGLADTIRSSGSTLNETLASVLSYAKINQFERQQHKHRERRPPDADWSLPNKTRLPQGPDMDFHGLYISTNIAMLCEEIAGVLDAGKSYSKTKGPHEVSVVVEINRDENWNYFTEPGALRRVATNIIGNALKYTTEGSVTITLATSKPELRSTMHDGEAEFWRVVTLRVTDTGKGISQDFMDKHLFVPFTQEDTTTSQGVGLGMSIVKSLVSLLAGEIKVASKVGVGTEVAVTIPMRLCRPDRGEIEEPSLELERSTLFIREQQLSVVLFGFPSVLRQGFEKYLREWFHCKILENTREARPDVVLVEESNKIHSDDVERMGRDHGQNCVLLSIVVAADALGKRMGPSPGYKKWERIPRPIGPNSIRKALWACVIKLRELREEEVNGYRDENVQGQGAEGQPDERSGEVDANIKDDVSNSSKERVKLDSTNRWKRPGSISETTPDVVADAPDGTPLPARPKKRASTETAGNLSRLRVLVVEDNAVNRKLMGAFLKKYGCTDFQFAENGALAIADVKGCSEGYDVIFMDLSMPIMDGFAATREIRRIETERCSSGSSSDLRSAAYIVALTGLASDQDEDDALTAGVDKFVTKPVNFQVLSKLLQDREGVASKTPEQPS